MKDYVIHEIDAPFGMEGYCLVDYTMDGVPWARRSFRGYSYLYVVQSGVNWVNGILSEDQFTFEEIMQAGAHIGP
jgi:hypothetical protein